MITTTSARRGLFLVSSAAASALFASTASAQLILNGSFESQPVETLVTATTTPNSSTFSNWFVATSSGSTRFAVRDTNSLSGAFPDAADGERYMVINGAETTAGVGRIYQDFATTLGQQYVVSFNVGHNSTTSALIGIKADVFNVISNAASGGSLGTATSSSSTPGSGFFAASTFNFTATGTTSRLIFADISNGTNSADALLDNVQVTAVPEPASAAALAGSVLLGFAIMRRRRRVEA